MKKYIILFIQVFMTCACQNEVLPVQQEEDGSYVLTAAIGQLSLDSRAQIGFDNQDEQMESFYWNTNDSFTFYQQVNGQFEESHFTILEDYDETQERMNIANFVSSDALIPSADYVAVFPDNVPLQSQVLKFSFQNEMDFSQANTEELKQNIWKQYMQNNMYMLAEGSVGEKGKTYVPFKHLCSMARITYVNHTQEEQPIDGIRLGGAQKLGSTLDYDIINRCSLGGESTECFELHTKGLSVAPGDKTDFYVFFFPESFVDGDISISILQPSGAKTVDLPTADIISVNGNSTAFQAGKRYWFDVTDGETGLDWTKNQELNNGILVENIELSQALQGILGHYKVVLDENGYAQMTQKHADNVWELDFGYGQYSISSLKGIESFINLTNLICNKTGLKECDLSQNTRLYTVELDDNELVQLDFSENKNLYSLSCNGNKEMTSLNLSGCENLLYLMCNETALTSVDIACPEKLYTLHYGNTALSFDLSKFSALNSLDCGGHEISSIDLSDDRKKYIRELRCYSCKINQLDFSKYENLEILECHDNLLMSLDVSNLTKLKELYCGKQQNGVVLELRMRESHLELWNTYWSKDVRNERVTTDSKENTGADDWGDGGEF